MPDRCPPVHMWATTNVGPDSPQGCPHDPNVLGRWGLPEARVEFTNSAACQAGASFASRDFSGPTADQENLECTEDEPGVTFT